MLPLGQWTKAIFAEKRRIWFFPIMALLLSGLFYWQNQELLGDRDSISYVYLSNALEGRFGYGLEGKYRNGISFDGLEPGDILLGGYPECAYGRFSHMAMYIGEGKVIESYVDLGVTIQSVEHFWDYSEICLLRVTATPEQKQAAVDYAQNRRGGMFYPVAFKPGDRFWNCSKIIWEAYRLQGVDLEEYADIWIAPEQIYRSRWVEIIREKSV